MNAYGFIRFMVVPQLWLPGEDGQSRSDGMADSGDGDCLAIGGTIYSFGTSECGYQCGLDE